MTAPRIGIFLSSEEHGPRDLVRFGAAAVEHGFADLSVSDHYHPWVGEQGNSPFVWNVLGGLAAVAPDARLGPTPGRLPGDVAAEALTDEVDRPTGALGGPYHHVLDEREQAVDVAVVDPEPPAGHPMAPRSEDQAQRRSAEVADVAAREDEHRAPVAASGASTQGQAREGEQEPRHLPDRSQLTDLASAHPAQPRPAPATTGRTPSSPCCVVAIGHPFPVACSGRRRTTNPR